MNDVLPPRAPLEGPAFTTGVKVLGCALTTAVVASGALAAPQLVASRSSWAVLLFLALALACVVACFVAMLRSRTRIDDTHIVQTWMSDKRVAIADITQIKLIYIPGLSWLIAPRLIVKTRFPGSTVFHAADREVLAAFTRLALGERPAG